MIDTIGILVVFALMGVAFHELFVRMNVLRDVRGVLNVAPAAVRTIRSDTLSDLEKERAVRRMSLEVLRDTLLFSAKFALVLLVCVAIAAVAQALFTLSPDGLYGLLSTWWAIVALIVAMPLYARLKRALGSNQRGADGAGADPVGATASESAGKSGNRSGSAAEKSDATDSYGPLDRLLHRIAFAHPALQRVLGDVENDMFRRQLAEVRVERPVFITGLPRAGTTLLLELLHGTGEFASYTYRQMPFVLAPLLWDRVSARSQQAAVARERAHGDAMSIDFDSPEAFEEVLWINRLSDTVFEGETMRTLGADDLDASFREAWRGLAAKLVCLRAAQSGGARDKGRGGDHPDSPTPLPRYLSKNNANIARLPAIVSVFPDATLLCCFREPAAHVASLHAQHLRFLSMHDSDAFAERYMAWTGHHDFGRNFRPIRFDGAIEVPAIEAEFWLRYWIDGYRHALATAPASTRFVGFDDLLAGGADALAALADELGLVRPASLVDASATLRAPTSVPESLEAISPALAAEAGALYAQLRVRAGYAPDADAPMTSTAEAS